MQNDETLLLHNDCHRMLKRPSKINLVNEVMYNLFGIKKFGGEYDKENKKLTLYEIILLLCGCYKD